MTSPADELRAAGTLLRTPVCGLPKPVADALFDWMADTSEDLSGAMVVASKWPDGDTADPIKQCDEPDSVRRALAFARALNGGQQS